MFSLTVPSTYINIDDKDPVWVNETIKMKIKGKKTIYTKNIFKTEDFKTTLFFQNFSNRT